jgi:hypothetical protein
MRWRPMIKVASPPNGVVGAGVVECDEGVDVDRKAFQPVMLSMSDRTPIYSREFPDAAWVQQASSGSFDCVVACAPTPLKMTD